MNLLEHYIIEVKDIIQLTNPNYINVKVLCDCWGNKNIVEHLTTKENWERELRQGYFLA